jgi:diguanylate cyclase (GGDEF)-like protein/PAS domain S-box-containing protein
MKKKRGNNAALSVLRRAAEERLVKEEKTRESVAKTKTEMRLLQELQVHKIELELQNEELLRTRSEVESLLNRYLDLYDFVPVGYFTLDSAGVIHHLNLSGAELFGKERSQLVRRNFRAFLAAQSLSDFDNFLQSVFQSGAKETCEVSLMNERNEILYLDLKAQVSEDGQECCVAAVDITERKQTEFELKYLSIRDPLTGLYNRGFFEEELARIERGRQFPVSIVMADVDGLKEINDRDGHAAGDALLKRVAQVLTTAFRAEDIIERIGGDEFAVLLPNTNAAAADKAICRLQRVLHEHNSAHPEAPVRLSFGVSTADKRASLSEVLREADEKMYRTKREHAMHAHIE